MDCQVVRIIRVVSQIDSEKLIQFYLLGTNLTLLGVRQEKANLSVPTLTTNTSLVKAIKIVVAINGEEKVSFREILKNGKTREISLNTSRKKVAEKVNTINASQIPIRVQPTFIDKTEEIVPIFD